MLSFALWKKLAVFGALALGLLYAVPNFIDAPEEGGLASILPGQSVNLGLDLQGGSYLLLKVDMEKVHEAPWYEMYPMFILIVIAAFFGIFPHYLMDPISTGSYDILDFMGVL